MFFPVGKFGYRSGCLRRFGGPDKEMRSISRADKLCRSNSVGMFRPKVCAQRNDLDIAEAEGPLGPEVLTDLLCAVERLYNHFFPLIPFSIPSAPSPNNIEDL
jgi:hypothetical protein